MHSELNPSVFTFHAPLSAIIQSVNLSISGTASNRNASSSFTAFCTRLWDAVDTAVGGLNDLTAVLSFAPDALEEIDDPFWDDRGCMYTLSSYLHARMHFAIDGRLITFYGAGSLSGYCC